MEVAAALLLSAFLLTYLWVRLPRWTLVDIFLLAISLYFGVLTLVDAITAPESNEHWILVAVVFTIIYFGAAVLCLASGAFKETSLSRLQQDWRNCPDLPIVGLIALAAGFRWYTSAFFGELGALGEAELMAVERDLPYWFTSVGMVVSTTIFAAGICAWGKVSISKGWRKLFWVGMTATSSFIVMGMGRRAILAMLIVIGWTILSGRRKHAIWLIALSIPVLLVLSNLYQAYRLVSYRGVPLENVISTDVGSIIDEAIAVNRTVSNLKDRQVIWRFNYEIVKAHLADNASLQGGELLFGEIPNYIPSAIYPGKTWRDSEETLLERFGLDRFDRPSNLFSYTYADFGLAAALVAPAIMIFWAWVCCLALRFMRDPFLRSLLMGIAIFYAINLETSYMVPIGLARDFTIVALAYVWLRLILSISRQLLPQHQSQQSH